MRKLSILVLCTVSLLLVSSCSPRDVLTHRLAADLIAGSDTFRTPQLWQLRTGIISNKDYLSPVEDHRRVDCVARSSRRIGDDEPLLAQ